MTIARQLQDQFRIAGRRGLTLTLCEHHSLFDGSCDVIATWRDGVSLKVARFAGRDAAESWLKSESSDWLDYWVDAATHWMAA